jgi:prepilin-type N-terminal cleavage/methylation domain-containing protein/prepilin-type processing-associated H-X9-DG protein
MLPIRPAHQTRRSLVSSRTAFTLIELLVVISIISLLISILLPALSSARAAAHGVACGSNMRQIGFAWEMYHHDFKGELVANTDEAGLGWMVTNAPSSRAGINNYLTNLNKVLMCPGEAISPYNTTTFQTTYSINSRSAGGTLANIDYFATLMTSTSTLNPKVRGQYDWITNPTRTIGFTEAYRSTTLLTQSHYRNNSTALMAYLHQNAAQIWLADGHVARVTPEESAAATDNTYTGPDNRYTFRTRGY